MKGKVHYYKKYHTLVTYQLLFQELCRSKKRGEFETHHYLEIIKLRDDKFDSMFCYDKNLLFTGTVSPLYTSKIRVLLISNGLEHVHLFVIELEHRTFGFERTDVQY